ncbi:hypothetical protein [Sporanaerobacter acetigenes]|uniref:Uncharacterized protein n=1 Tax=Sporanaerobacter acetigenes DSM 13106 TaxID=1123281 RepID=A0A1M5W034_9FIRM|nr:hypothetical protein [Sporanaerobacter acetigenes]SHH80876.1 hypothetical protein SAMN02745180_01134 [Sporanaerobacter acetigenes DSM 13106]
MNQIQKYFVDTYNKDSHYNRKYVENPTDLKQFTDEQLKEARKDLKNQANILVQISKPYKIDNKKYYVFTKSSIDFKDSETEGLIITRKYMFTKENNRWKIAQLEQELSNEKIPEDKLKYTTKNNKKVEYVKSFDIK